MFNYQSRSRLRVWSSSRHPGLRPGSVLHRIHRWYLSSQDGWNPGAWLPNLSTWPAEIDMRSRVRMRGGKTCARRRRRNDRDKDDRRSIAEVTSGGDMMASCQTGGSRRTTPWLATSDTEISSTRTETLWTNHRILPHSLSVLVWRTVLQGGPMFNLVRLFAKTLKKINSKTEEEEE